MADANPNADTNDPLADELLQMGNFGDVAGATPSAPISSSPAPVASYAPPADDPMSPDLAELEALLQQATFDDATGSVSRAKDAVDDLTSELMNDSHANVGFDAPRATSQQPLPSTMPFDLPAFQQAITDAQASSIDLLRDVDLNVKIELGRSRMLVDDVLKLSEGSVVELDKLAGDPVDVFVNDRLVARGEVLVLNDNFCVRVNEIVASIKEEN